MGLFPPGRFVLLSNMTLGRVARAGGTLDRPVVKTFPSGHLVDLSSPAHASVTVQRLLQEPEFVQLLMTSKDGVIDPDAGSNPEPPAPLPSTGPDGADEPARNEEFAVADSEGAGEQASCQDDHDHGDDCRLC